MSLQFIRGTAVMDLETKLVNESVDWLTADANREVFYLVPNHMKFEQEINVLKRIKNLQETTAKSVTTMRLQVFSFYRLAWYFLQHTQYYSSEMLTEAGAAMIFKKVLSENEEKLHVFRGEMNKAGFIQQLFDLYQEMKAGNIQLEDLESLLMEGNLESKQLDIQMKVQDIRLIFSEFEEKLASYGLKSTEIINHLTDYLESQDLSNVLFIVNGYHHFTAREYKLIEVLLRKGGAVKISLLLDKKYPTIQPELNDLFYETGNTYFQLYQLARKNQVVILPDYVESEKYLVNEDVLKQLNQYWILAQQEHRVKPFAKVKQESLQIWKAENLKEEINHVAKEIRRLVVEENYRYKDIQLLTRELDCYENLIEPLFSIHQVPVYLDRDMAMEQHPLVEFIQALFDVEAYHYRYKDVLRFLRTELFIPYATTKEPQKWIDMRNDWRRKVDITENVVLAYGYEGYHWTRAEDWQFIRYDFEAEKVDDTKRVEQESNQVRQSIQQKLPNFFKGMAEATTGANGADLFYQFLVNIGVEQQLLMWRQQAIEKGQLETGKNHEQTWDALMTLLDEYVTIYGEDAFDFDTFKEILASGLEGLRYSKVPTAIDQVQVRSVDLARPGQAKVIFAIGLTDQVFPQKIENKTLLSDEERLFVNENLEEDQFLIKEARKMIAKEPFMAYLMFSAATERLYLSYPNTKDTVQDIKPSAYLRMIQQALGIASQEKNELTLTDNEETSLQHVGTFRTLISELTNLKRQKKETGEPILPLWLALEKELFRQPNASFTRGIFESLSHQNVPENLANELAESLYGKEIYTSVSRMESFYRCQYQYFSRFGLGLKERDVFGLSAAATGDFFHEALDQFFKLLLTTDQHLSQLSEKEVKEFTEKVLESIFGEARFSILNSTSRMNYIRFQLGQTIQKVSWALKKQSEKSGMTTLQTEVIFGQIASQKGIQGLELPLQNNGKIHVRGKIDRVDQLVTSEATYLGVIDYKSSHKKFNISEAYYGLAMQMLTYLDVAMMDAVNLLGTAAKPAGSFYFHVHNPILPYEEEEKRENQVLKKYQLDGIMLNDQNLLDHLDKSLEAKQTSVVFPIEESAKELIKPGRRQEDKFVSQSELEVLLAHNRSRFVAAGNKITGGEIALNPAYQGKERVACRFCPFQSVCEFDVMLKENNYHRLETMNKKEVMNRLTEEATGGETDE